ncbi:MAG TPA: chemotaxis protein CheW [Bryobacteraceae bacterium]|jgi:purine-binding chemotaxis protein CheW
MAAVVTHSQESSARTDARAGKYLTFQLGSEEFGIRVMQVREIMGLQDITAVPHTPPYVKGVINLRGKVVPVLCLRSRFRMETAEATSVSCIIVVQVQLSEGDAVLAGVIVDAVSDVVNIAPAEIEDTPDFGSGKTTPYLLGMAKVKGKVKILLDIDQVVKATDLAELNEMPHEHDA